MIDKTKTHCTTICGMLLKQDSMKMLTFGDFPGGLPEKAMAPHSSTLAWKIPWMVEPGRLQSMGSRGVGHD